MSEVFSWIIAGIGCLIGVWGWFHSRDTKIDKDATWRGEVNAKLDLVINQGTKISELAQSHEQLKERVIVAERDLKSAHRRIDEVQKKVS